MKNKINIKVVADLICPWCFIGCNHLNEAIKSRQNLKFEIDWQSFYLNPTIPTIGSERRKYLKNKFGNQVNMVETQIINVANSYGIEINLNNDLDILYTIRLIDINGKVIGRKSQLLDQVGFKLILLLYYKKFWIN